MKRPINRTVVSLDVGSSGARAAQFTVRGKTCRLDRMAVVPLAPGVVAGGVVADPAALTAALTELWSAGKFTTKDVVFGLANDRILVRQLDLDWMEPADFRKALAYSVADQIPMSVDEANLDFHVLEEIPASAELGLERTLRVLLVAAGRDMVEGFVSAITAAGLRPIKAELSPFALIRVACPDGASAGDPTSAEAIVDIGADTLTVVVHTGGQPRFVRTVGKLGGRFITGELQQKFGWSYEEAEEAKTSLGLPRQRPAGDDLVALDHPAQQAIAERVGAVVAEIRTTLNFFLSASTGITALSRVVLTGGGANLAGLPEHLAEGLKVEVAALLPPAEIRVPGRPAEVAAPAAGSAGKGGSAKRGVAKIGAAKVGAAAKRGHGTKAGHVPAHANGAAPAAGEAPRPAPTTGAGANPADPARATGLSGSFGLPLLAGLALGVA